MSEVVWERVDAELYIMASAMFWGPITAKTYCVGKGAKKSLYLKYVVA